MGILISVSLMLHAVSGFIAFGLAPVAMAAAKGSSLHRRAGKVYFYAMTVAAGSALLLATLRWNLFLLLIGIFSYYLVFSGYRAVMVKIRRSHDAGVIDWLAAAIMGVFGFGMLGYAALLVSQEHFPDSVVVAVFGGISLLIVRGNIRRFLGADDRHEGWLQAHIGGMGGAWIAAVTAFLATNATFLPALAVWLGPTVIGSLLIAAVVRRHRRQQVRQRPAGQSVR